MSSDCDESCDGHWQTKDLDTLWPIWGEGFFLQKIFVLNLSQQLCPRL